MAKAAPTNEKKPTQKKSIQVAKREVSPYNPKLPNPNPPSQNHSQNYVKTNALKYIGKLHHGHAMDYILSSQTGNIKFRGDNDFKQVLSDDQDVPTQRSTNRQNKNQNLQHQ